MTDNRTPPGARGTTLADIFGADEPPPLPAPGTAASAPLVDPYADVPPPSDDDAPAIVAAPATQPAESVDDTALLGVLAPPVLSDGALQGRAGRIVRALAPHTEAAPAALLATLLAWFGAVVGNAPHVELANNQHPARLWPLIVGKTSGGAKGTSLQVIRALMHRACPGFDNNVSSGLTSGEGLIESVRDQVGDGPDAPDFDEGVGDKRALILESEFATVLARGRREGNTLTQVLREAWDGGTLQTKTRKANALKATDHHIVVVGHITPNEMLRVLRSEDLSGGTLNRFLMFYSHRAQLLPGGGNIPSDVLDDLAAEVTLALTEAGRRRTVPLDDEAAAYWSNLVPILETEQDDDRAAEATARPRPQVRRLALAYALLDGAPAVGFEHLAAASELWEYCAQTARWLFANDDQDAESAARARLLDYLADAGPDGATRTEIRELFARHKSSTAIAALLAPLVRSGRVAESKRPTNGRAATVYTLATIPKG